MTTSALPSWMGNNNPMASWGMPVNNVDSLAGTSLAGMGNYAAGTQSAIDATGASGWSDWLFGGKTKDGGTSNGAASTLLGVAQGLGNAYMGMKQYGLAKDTFNENKRQFNLNFDTQKKLTNGRLADRQAARVASNPGAYQSVGDYMKTNGIG